MATLSAAGVGSGLDVNGIVQQLMAVERQPLTKLNSQISSYQTQVSAYGKLKSALSSFESSMDGLASVKKFQVFSATSGDEDIFTASATQYASVGTYDITVNRLAQNHKTGTAMYASTDTFGGTAGDKLNVAVGSSSMSVDLSSGKTLSEIRDAINNSSSNPGVTATIITGDSGQQKLVLRANDTGYDNRVQLSGSGTIDPSTTFGFATMNTKADGSTMLDSEVAQLDASMDIDGVTVTRSSNTIDDVLKGVTFNLKKVDTTTSYTLTVARDDSAITKSVQNFVTAYNNVMSSIKDLRKQGGDLEADNTVLSIQNQIRAGLNDAVATGGAYSYLAEIGIESDSKTGTLSVNTTDLQTALDNDYESVANLFGKEGSGIAAVLKDTAHQMTFYDGLIENRKKGINERIDVLQKRVEDMQYRLDRTEERYQKQYGSLDTLLAQMQSTSTALTSQLATLPG